MKYLTLIACLVFYSCQNSSYKIEEFTVEEELKIEKKVTAAKQYEEPAYEEDIPKEWDHPNWNGLDYNEYFDEWIKDNSLSLHEKLISVNVKLVADDYDFEEDYKPYDFKIQTKGNHLVVSYVQLIWSGCKKIGNIKVKDNKVFLLWDSICPPNTEAVMESIDYLKFTYTLKNDRIFQDKIWQVEAADLMTLER